MVFKTVNITSRVEGLADAGEIYTSVDVHNFPGVREAVEHRKIASEEVVVKGLSDTLRVYIISIR